MIQDPSIEVTMYPSLTSLAWEKDRGWGLRVGCGKFSSSHEMYFLPCGHPRLTPSIRARGTCIHASTICVLGTRHFSGHCLLTVVKVQVVPPSVSGSGCLTVRNLALVFPSVLTFVLTVASLPTIPTASSACCLHVPPLTLLPL